MSNQENKESVKKFLNLIEYLRVMKKDTETGIIEFEENFKSNNPLLVQYNIAKRRFLNSEFDKETFNKVIVALAYKEPHCVEAINYVFDEKLELDKNSKTIEEEIDL